MDQTATVHGNDAVNSASLPSASASKRNGVSAPGSGLLSKIPFMRPAADHRSSRPDSATDGGGEDETGPSEQQHLPSSMSTVLQQQPQQQQQQRTRRRRGSLRKVALLGRGAQRERRESRSGSIDMKHTSAAQFILDGYGGRPSSGQIVDRDSFGLGISDLTPRPSMDGYASRSVTAAAAAAAGSSTPLVSSPVATAVTPPPIKIPKAKTPQTNEPDSLVTSPSISYSTTDDEDALHIGGGGSGAASAAAALLRPEHASLSSGSESYFPNRAGPLPLQGLPSIQRRRSIHRAKSPLALTGLTGGGLAATPLPAPDSDWDYSETEWWGWVVLAVTWVVFVTGMGSCLGVWSWAWDVGTTPYAPPELEDDPTLPIVGYYPSLIILTCVMAWVWVVVAWVGMKYFRHARVSGD